MRFEEEEEEEEYFSLKPPKPSISLLYPFKTQYFPPLNRQNPVFPPLSTFQRV
jgi:hypothetical protein